MIDTQRKIDLAVLLKMFQDAADDGSWVTRHDIKAMFSVLIPMRFIEAATEKLLEQGDIVKDYDPLKLEESRWQLSRAGIEKVQRAMKVQTSFIARLAKNGDIWLQSEEAKAAVLKKIPEQNSPLIEAAPLKSEPTLESSAQSITIHNTFSPSSSHTTEGHQSDSASVKSSASAGWVSAWATWVGTAVAFAALLWAIYSYEVF